MTIYFDSWGAAHKDWALSQPVQFCVGYKSLVDLDRQEWSIGTTDWAIAEYFGYPPVTNECGPDSVEIPDWYFEDIRLEEAKCLVCP